MSGPGDRKQLGKILLRQKLVTAAELEGLLEEQKQQPGTRLASAAARSGIVDEVELLGALSAQHGVDGIDLLQVVIPTQNLRLVPIEVARESGILPFAVKDDELHLAMADPTDKRVIDEIEFVTGKTVHPYVALHEQLLEVVDAAFSALASGDAHYIGPRAPESYLEALGLAPAKPQPPAQPPAKQGTKRLPTLDPAFDSGVAPLPKDEIAQALRAPDQVQRVLVVDDEDDIRRMLRRVLTERGFQVLEANKGNDALQMVREHLPDLIVLDAMLPEIHGFDICRRIKGSQKYGHIPIIMVSAIYRGWRFAEDLRESYGVEVFLEKPFKISDVVSAVEKALQGQPTAADEDEEDLSEGANEALTAGIDAYKAGDLESAITHLRRGVSLDPLSFRLHYHLGLLYGRRDNLFEAIHEMETAVELGPRNFAALKNLAVLYQRAGFKHRAIEIWERALSSAPDEETKRGIKEHLMSLL